MTSRNHSRLRFALATAAGLLALTGGAVTAVAHADDDPGLPPVFTPGRDVGVSGTDLVYDGNFRGTATVTVTQNGQVLQPGDLTVTFRVTAADSVRLDGNECLGTLLDGSRYRCVIPNDGLPARGLISRFDLVVQSHQMTLPGGQPVKFRDETYTVEIDPQDADPVNDHHQAAVLRP